MSPGCRSGHLPPRPATPLKADAMWTPAPSRSFLLVALGLGALSGCSIFEPEVCLLRPCARFKGLVVRLTSRPTGPYSVELRVPGAEQPFHLYECDGGPSCHDTIGSPLLHLRHVSIRVTTAAGSVVTDVPNVEYKGTKPNGHACWIPCPNATVTAEVPG